MTPADDDPVSVMRASIMQACRESDDVLLASASVRRVDDDSIEIETDDGRIYAATVSLIKTRRRT